MTTIATRPSVYEGVDNMFSGVFLPLAEQFILRQPGRRFTGECDEFIDQVHRANGITERDLVLGDKDNTETESLLVPLRLYLTAALKAQGGKFHLQLDGSHRDSDGVLFINVGYMF